ncbi:stage II sporulation protein B [Geomicrobium sp. JCM 19037]|uniref:hypothetical protein n=1 Tax=Geomicrobium sp. JCM 19037 TaxID=1460634 RepID=UPI00045F2BFB|nr:hypothetical protein [Geomicrobium sp. JCM 19037]GAK03193.1 stage II sporulation protein B [Geomicrobium sp. JCM 19037]
MGQDRGKMTFTFQNENEKKKDEPGTSKKKDNEHNTNEHAKTNCSSSKEEIARGDAQDVKTNKKSANNDLGASEAAKKKGKKHNTSAHAKTNSPSLKKEPEKGNDQAVTTNEKSAKSNEDERVTSEGSLPAVRAPGASKEARHAAETSKSEEIEKKPVSSSSNHETVDVVQKKHEWEQKGVQETTSKKAPGLPFHRKKKPSGSGGPKRKGYGFDRVKFVGLIAAALLLGVVFGLPLLQIVTSSSPTDSAEEVMGTAEEEGATTSVGDEVTWAPLEVDVVQAGAFSSMEAGEDVQRQLVSAGYPAVLHDASDSEYIFLYVGMTEANQAEQDLMPEFEANGMDVYVKQLQIEPESETIDQQ